MQYECYKLLKYSNSLSIVVLNINKRASYRLCREEVLSVPKVVQRKDSDKYFDSSRQFIRQFGFIDDRRYTLLCNRLLCIIIVFTC